MLYNPIGAKEDTRTATIIKTLIEEEFRTTYGKQFEWKKLWYRAVFREIEDRNNLSMKYVDDQNKMKVYLKEILKNSDKYKFVSSNEKDQTIFLQRDNKYKEVTDPKTLRRLIEEHPEGILVDDELLFFTYKDVKRDIDRFVNEKIFKKLYSASNKADQFYIFPRKIEIEYEVREQSFIADFGMEFYMDICRKFNAVSNEDQNAKVLKLTIAKDSKGDPNYQLPNYLGLKEKWLQRGVKK